MTDPQPRPVALVTGAARRVGRAIAVELARAGYDIVIHYNKSRPDAEHTADLIRQEKAHPLLVAGDLVDPHAPQDIMAEVTGQLGHIDVLVNNASIFEAMDLEHFDAARWHQVMQINLAAPIQFCQLAAPLMRRQGGGSIVNISDIAAQQAWKNYLAYGPAKAGLDYMTRALARALAPQIRVNAVAPGIAVFPEDYPEELRDRLIARVPLRRSGTPEDIARTVRFLVESPYITGQVISVDGGRSSGV